MRQFLDNRRVLRNKRWSFNWWFKIE